LDCHTGSDAYGRFDLEALQRQPDSLETRRAWWRALKQIRSQIMPPREADPLTPQDSETLQRWMVGSGMGLDSRHPEPGQVTVRRLNRTEYRNTIRELLGVEFDTFAEFPADDTGHGFDNIGEVLNISPLLLEKYLDAAVEIVQKAVPDKARVLRRQSFPAKYFDGEGTQRDGRLVLPYYKPANHALKFDLEKDGQYELVLRFGVQDQYVENKFDENRCLVRWTLDGQELFAREYRGIGDREFRPSFKKHLAAGEHRIAIQVEPLTDKEQIRNLEVRVREVELIGPDREDAKVAPSNHAKFFPKAVPESTDEKRAYAGEILGPFATKAFRRPIRSDELDRLVGLAESIYEVPGATFEFGIQRAMIGILASPRFLLREEAWIPNPDPNATTAYLDDYSLATRLSYFLWSSMPDSELTDLAAKGELRSRLSGQMTRMLADRRAKQFPRHFVGQWLQLRNVDSVTINAFAVISRDEQSGRSTEDFERRRQRSRELRDKQEKGELTAEEQAELTALGEQRRRAFARFRDFELTDELRRDMRGEIEQHFEYLLREDQSLLDLLDCDYAFLNERLAKHYGIDGIQGKELTKVALPKDSPRGGVLTSGAVLAITSNPDRTSPVKRGLFLLDNLLGTPPAPPPPDIPSLEDSAKEKGKDLRTLTLRENLELHQSDPKCAACHARMDPLGLALENFNALGIYRENERGTPIDSSGRLISGEAFSTVGELKSILKNQRRRDFYRCLTEKMMTYALGRGLDYYDVPTVDDIVDKLDASGGKPSVLLQGILRSPAFQQTRVGPSQPGASAPTTGE
jgi:hypothetical protein